MTTFASQPSSDRLLGFETEFAERLPCIPMAVRRKLDLSGAKISLAQWSQLPFPARQTLLLDPVADDTSASLWKELLDTFLRDAGAEPAKLLPIDDAPAWARRDAVPAEVAAQIAANGLELPTPRWEAIDELLRFALTKLSRPGHENRNFLAAAREAGLAP